MAINTIRHEIHTTAVTSARKRGKFRQTRAGAAQDILHLRVHGRAPCTLGYAIFCGSKGALNSAFCGSKFAWPARCMAVAPQRSSHLQAPATFALCWGVPSASFASAFHVQSARNAAARPRAVTGDKVALLCSPRRHCPALSTVHRRRAAGAATSAHPTLPTRFAVLALSRTVEPRHQSQRSRRAPPSLHLSSPVARRPSLPARSPPERAARFCAPARNRATVGTGHGKAALRRTEPALFCTSHGDRGCRAAAGCSQSSVKEEQRR